MRRGRDGSAHNVAMPFYRSEPHEYTVHFANGKVKHEGRGLSFWYWRINSSIAKVPLNIRDSSFAFKEVTRDFQAVTYQGQTSYRFVNPSLAVSSLNLSIDPSTGRYIDNDLALLDQRVANAVNSAAGAEIQAQDLASALRSYDVTAAAVLERVRKGQALDAFGIEITSLIITSIRPTPEVAKAMEAGLREEMLRRADEAIYARRNAAIEEERKISEQEMATQLAMESRRQELVAVTGANLVAEAEARGKAQSAEAAYVLERLREELELWRALDPRLIAALGFKALGDKGAQQMTVTTEVLSALLQDKQS